MQTSLTREKEGQGPRRTRRSGGGLHLRAAECVVNQKSSPRNTWRSARAIFKTTGGIFLGSYMGGEITKWRIEGNRGKRRPAEISCDFGRVADSGPASRASTWDGPGSRCPRGLSNRMLRSFGQDSSQQIDCTRQSAPNPAGPISAGPGIAGLQMGSHFHGMPPFFVGY
jgi:hypothetical protein